MAKRNDPTNIVAGAGLLTAIFTDLNRLVMERGGSAEDLHRLTKPEGTETLRKIADLIVSGRTRHQLSFIANFSIRELNLGVRSYNALARVGIETFGDLVVKSPEQLKKLIPNFSDAMVDDVERCLAIHGLHLGTKL